MVRWDVLHVLIELGTLCIFYNKSLSMFGQVTKSTAGNWYFLHFNTLTSRQNGPHFADDVFKCIFSNENVWISLTISLKLIPKVPLNNIPALFQIMAWRRSGDKPLFEPMMVSSLTHIWVTRPQRVHCINIVGYLLIMLHNKYPPIELSTHDDNTHTVLCHLNKSSWWFQDICFVFFVIAMMVWWQ